MYQKSFKYFSSAPPVAKSAKSGLPISTSKTENFDLERHSPLFHHQVKNFTFRRERSMTKTVKISTASNYDEILKESDRLLQRSQLFRSKTIVS